MVMRWISPEDLADADAPAAEWAIDAASWILFKLSGEKYTGVITTTEVYSSRSDDSPSKMVPQIVNGQIVHLPAGTVGSTRLRLKHSPVRSIQAVKVGGVLMDPSKYQLRNNAHLVRRDGMTWTSSPNRELEITYTYGANPPAMGIAAAIRLANEFIWNDEDSDLCTLPERISSSVTRQGVSYTVLDPQDFLDQGRTGITIVDMFINTANPAKAKKRPRIYSPTGLKAERIN